MYQIVTLGGPPSIKDPFMPNFLINGAPAPGLTYGIDLNAYTEQYSKTLTDLIYQCLYQNPNHRISLADLKAKTVKGYASALTAGSRLEDWANFLPIPAGNLVTLPCEGTDRNGGPCGNTRRGLRLPNIRCYNCMRHGR
jgi:hypothetical protein